MGKKLLITGGVLRPNGFELGEGKYYGCAKLLRLDLQSGRVDELLSMDQGTANFPAVDPNLEFTSATFEGRLLWLPTDAEIRKYAYPSLELLAVFSHPCFHNIHSVAVHGDDLYVTSTGLDLVVVLDKRDGSIREYLNAEGKPTWHRFSPDTDHRQLYSTRPHDCHPNYVFWHDGMPWVTRCTQEDAFCLRDPSRPVVDISTDKRPISVHDGRVYGDKVLFTLVDGSLIVVDMRAGRAVESIDVTSMEGFGGVRGWCRGLHIEGDMAYIGFSRLRPTRRMEKLAWIKRLLSKGATIEQGSVLAVDLAERRIVGDVRIEPGQIDAIYSLLPVPDDGAV